MLYVTERAVFALTRGGLTLREVAPGIDPHSLLPLMDFGPVSVEPRLMPAHCFEP